MDEPPIIRPLSDADLHELLRAKALIERPGLAIRLANLVGSPLEKGFALLPKNWNAVVNKAAHNALMKALSVAVATLGHPTGRGSREFSHKVMAGVSGGFGGLFGLAALPIELPISTTIMMRSIADVARSEGHDLSNIETRLSCLEVFALGCKEATPEAAQSAYWATRAALTQSISEAASHIARKGVVSESAPAIARLIAQIAARFGVVISEEVAAKAIPILGAVGGGTINVMFITHFQAVARGHFIIQRLEKQHGRDQLRAAYERLALK